MNSLIGLVMCGGSSTRMDTDKGLIKSGDHTWAEIAYRKLKVVIEEVYISINTTQAEQYKKFISEKYLIEDNVFLKGPLAGLFSANKILKGKDIFILACDMINVDTLTLKKILDSYLLNRNNHDFFVYKKQQIIEPMPGIYANKGITNSYNSFLSGNLKKYSLMHILENGNTYYAAASDDDRLENFNYPKDVKE